MWCLLLFVNLICSTFTTSQVDERQIRRQVLESSLIDSLFVFGKWDAAKGTDETHLRYLGAVTTVTGKSYKIMTSIVFWGQARHATSNIFIYDSNNQYVGNFKVFDVDDLPVRLDNGVLIFRSKEECDQSIITNIDLRKGIPGNIFIRCNGENGDLYNFVTVP